jgi:hypothetical protein
MTLLKATHQLKKLALSTALGAFVSLGITIPLYATFGKAAILPVLILGAFSLLCIYLWATTRHYPYRLNFRHPHFSQRYLMPSELRGDTIWLLPVASVLGEVIIWGRRRFDERMANILKPSPQQELLNQLPQTVPSGPNVLALAGWLYEKTIGKAVEKRSRRKKHQRAMREKEEEYQRRWDMLRDTTRVASGNP